MLDVRVEQTPDGAIAYPEGEIDIATAPALRKCLATLSGHVVVDLSGVTFLDSSGMNALIGERKRLNEEGGGLHVRSPSDVVQRALEVTGLGALLETDHS